MRPEMTITVRDARQTLLDAAQALSSRGESFISSRCAQSAEQLAIIASGQFPCCDLSAQADHIESLLDTAATVRAALPPAPSAAFVPPTPADYAGYQPNYNAGEQAG